MARTLLICALILGLCATALKWLEYRYVAGALQPSLYITGLAAGFVLIGIWVGRSLSPKQLPGAFHRNEAAIRSLALSPREIEVLEALVTGGSNKELARRLGISPNTVKTHVSRIYAKLSVERRVQAIERARLLALIP